MRAINRTTTKREGTKPLPYIKIKQITTMAKTELKALEGCRRQLRIEVEPETVKKAYQEVIRGAEKTAQIPGFRPGKAPREIIKERYRDIINKEIVEKLIPETYREALKEQDLKPVCEPEIIDLDMTEERLAYTALFDVAPVVELESYSGLSLEKKEMQITEEEVNRVLEEVLTHNPKLQIEARDLKTRDNLKKSLRQRLEYQAQAIAGQEEDERIVEQLLSRSKFTAPESLVNERAVDLVRRELMRMPDIKTKNEAEQKKLASELFEKMKPRAEKEVKASFVLTEIARREKVEVSEEDAGKRIEILAKMAGKEKEEFAANISAEEREELKGQMRIERTLALLKKRSLLINKPVIIKA